MDILDYVKDLISEIKLIILANLDVSLLKDFNVSQNISEIIFKYRYDYMYYKIKDIIKINKSLNFRKYTEEGPYFWKILVNDKLELEVTSVPNNLFIVVQDSWKYFDLISIDIEIMVLFYKTFPIYYKYINKMFDDKYGLYLLGFSLSFYLEGFSFLPDYKGGDATIEKVLKTGEAQEIVIKTDEYAEMMGTNEAIILIVISYFMLQFIPKDQLIIPIEMMGEYLDIIRTRRPLEDDDQDDFEWVLYKNFGDIFSKYLENI